MFLSSLSIKRPIMVTMGLLVFLLFGILAYFSLPLNKLPDVEIGYVTVQTVYPGAGPSEIESQITKKIEDAVSTISKIDNIRSYTMESISIIVIQFEMGKDPDIANQEVKDKVNLILNDLPKDADIPIIEKIDLTAEPILDITLTGNLEIRELHQIADDFLKDRFSQIEGVAKVDLIGGVEREIRVETDNRTVFQNSLSLTQLSQILAAQNMDMPGGNFQQSSQEYSVRLQGQFKDLETIRNLEVPTAFGMKKLRQIADVKDSGEDVRERSIFFDNISKTRDENVILLSLTKTPDGNVVQIAEQVKNTLPELQKELPAGCNLTLVGDNSTFIKSSVEDTLGNIIMGVILTGIVLLFFLHDLRSTIIVALAMPMSILSTFFTLQISGFTLNIMTLMGLSTAVGVLVTNSVVVLENIFRHKEMGHSRKIAADKGTAETAVAVIASTMTNIVVFLPIAFMSSMVGQFFKEFALTVTYATVFSIIMSFTLTPMLASILIPEHDEKKHPIGKFLENVFKSWEKFYKAILKSIIFSKKRAFLVVFTAIILFIGGMFIGSKVGFEFFPQMDEGKIMIEMELPQGYNLEQTAEKAFEAEQKIKQYSAVKHIITQLGSLGDLDIGTNMAKLQIQMKDLDKREISSEEAANKFIEDLSSIPNAKIRVILGGGEGEGGSSIKFYLLGQQSDVLEKYKNMIVEKLNGVQGLINLNTSSRAGKPEITLIPYRDKISDAGLTIYDIAMTIRSAVDGITATQYKEEGNEYDIKVTLTDESINSPEKIGNLAVVSPKGSFRLSQLADVKFTEGYSKILHKDKYTTIEIGGDPAQGYALGDIVEKIRAQLSNIELPSGYKIDWGGDVQMMEETAAEMLKTFLIALALTYMLLAAILESFTQPLLILGTVPLALIGVFTAMYITGKTMNTISMMAIVMLLGIVVNNAILLLDYTNLLIRKKGRSVHDALVEACPTKLKPIIMSTLAIMLGMLPMALGVGSAGKEIRQPMGIVSIGGLLVSSVLTLIVIPTLYYLTTKNKPQTSEEEE